MGRLISIIVPVYKVEQYLDRCVESLVKQTYSNIEIILVDDGSPDRCPQICDEWVKKDSRIAVIHKVNGGLSDARNHGIRRAKGEYILFVDSDDYLVEDAVERLEAYTDNEDLIVGESTIIYPDKQIHRVHTNLEENHIYSGKEYVLAVVNKGEWFAAACYNMYKREFLIDNDLFFVVGILHEDNEYVTRLFYKAQTIKYIHFEFYQYIMRDESICNKPSEKNISGLFEGFSRWKTLTDSIHDIDLKKAYAGTLCKSYIHTCRIYNITERAFPSGMDEKYLFNNALNYKELVKTIFFIVFRKKYIGLRK